MIARMKRREFITLLGGAAAAPMLAPRVARAQQAMPVVGIMHPGLPATMANQMQALSEGLKDTGFTEGKNVALEYRYAENQRNRLRDLAADLVRRQVKVIAALGSPSSALAAKSATSSIPIVFRVAEDPVRLGLVASLARPGGNATGINFLSVELVGKRLELLRALVPAVARVAVLVNPANAANAETTANDVQSAARAMGLQIQFFNAGTGREIDIAFAAMARQRPDALFVATDPFLGSRRVQLVNLASRHGIPAAYSRRDIAEIGGLMSYGSNIAASYREVGIYIGRILKGTRPADLPVLQPSKFEFVINLQTARRLGLAVPPSLLAIADEVIE
jgi:putative ABC transport system substrate-binding protein